MTVPDLDFIQTTCSDSADLIYLGTELGIIYVISASEQIIRQFSPLNWKNLFPHAQKLCPTNPVTSIHIHRKKPYRILVTFKFTGAAIYNIRKKKITQIVNTTRTEIFDSCWAYDLKGIGLVYSSGDIVFFNSKGKLRAPLLIIPSEKDQVEKIFWIKQEALPAILISQTINGKIYAYQIGKTVLQRNIGFTNGAQTIFAGEIYTIYNEASNGQIKNLNKSIYFRLLVGISKTNKFSYINLDKSIQWDQKHIKSIERPIFTNNTFTMSEWNLPSKIEIFDTENTLCEQEKIIFEKYKENLLKNSLSEDTLLSVFFRVRNLTNSI